MKGAFRERVHENPAGLPGKGKPRLNDDERPLLDIGTELAQHIQPHVDSQRRGARVQSRRRTCDTPVDTRSAI